jgi:hypothetical protein
LRQYCLSLLACSLALVSCKSREYNESDAAGLSIGTTKTTYNVFFQDKDSGRSETTSCFYELDNLTRVESAQIKAARGEDDFRKLFPLLRKGTPVTRNAIFMNSLKENVARDNYAATEIGKSAVLNAVISPVSCLVIGLVAPLVGPLTCMGVFGVGAAATVAKVSTDNTTRDKVHASANNHPLKVLPIKDKDQDLLRKLVRESNQSGVACPKATELFATGN